LKLLDPMKAQIKSKEGGEMSLGGFMAVNRDRLKALPGETLSDLAKTNELELLYLQLASMRNMSVMAERMMAGDQAQGSGTAPS
jgi:hypothetical protein